MENYRTVYTEAEKTPTVSRAKARRTKKGADWHRVRPQERHPVEHAPKGDGLRLGLLVQKIPGQVAGRWRLAEYPRSASRQTARSGQARLVASGRGLRLGKSCFWGQKTGPNPTDRRKLGSKHNVITDAAGVPFAVTLTPANRHDINELLPLVDSIPHVFGKPGRPKNKPDAVLGDRGYDSEPHRQALREMGIKPVIAKRREKNGSGLGVLRWVVERTISWLHQYRRLRVRYERLAEVHEAFMSLGCIFICWKVLCHA